MDQSILSSRAVIGMYYAAQESNPGLAWVNKIANRFYSDQSSETYPFLGQSPVMREWIGGRQAKGWRSNSLTVVNKHFEATMEVRLTDMRRDKTGQIEARIAEFVERQNAHWASLISTLLAAGPSAVCYDGQFFFRHRPRRGQLRRAEQRHHRRYFRAASSGARRGDRAQR